MPYRRVRPHASEKVQRNQALIEYHQAHPEATLLDIGQIFGITVGRVWQILRRYQPNGSGERDD